MIYFSPGSALKVEAPAKQALEMSRVVSYHWKKKKIQCEEERGEEAGVDLPVDGTPLKGKVSGDWGLDGCLPTGRKVRIIHG